MRYLVITQQAGYGCDYSIGCGTSVEEVTADSAEEAFSKMVDGTDWYQEEGCWKYNSPGGEHEFSSIWVVPAPELNEHLWGVHIVKMNEFEFFGSNTIVSFDSMLCGVFIIMIIHGISIPFLLFSFK